MKLRLPRKFGMYLPQKQSTQISDKSCAPRGRCPHLHSLPWVLRLVLGSSQMVATVCVYGSPGQGPGRMGSEP